MTGTKNSRLISDIYTDPVEVIWQHAASRLGLRIERGQDVYASYDGRGTLRLSAPGELDPDDSPAQLIFHELCHALVMGPEAWAQQDWGLSNLDARHLTHEHACHRVQAALADRYGLRDFMAVTTDHRPYWDTLPADPLADGDDPAIPLARAAFQRAQQPPFAPVLQEALERTAGIAELVRPIAPEDSLWK